MAHNLEQMFYVSNEQNGRFVPWHGLGTPVEKALTSAEALEMAGLNWTVDPHPVFTDTGIQIPGYVANTRSSDNSVLGIVSDKYKIVQNAEAFQFTDNLIGDEVRYETAGSLRNGKSIWMLAKMPRERILGDDIQPYMCFTNTHDGTGAIKVCMTPIRVVCNNTLNLALEQAKRVWTCRHMGRIEDKLAEAEETLELSHKYMAELGTMAERLANMPLKDEEIYKIVAEMFPVNQDEQSHRQLANMEKARTEFMIAYYMPDIEQFRNTAWGLLNACSDFVGHSSPQRNTSTYQERNFERIIYGHPLMDALLSRCGANAQ